MAASMTPSDPKLRKPFPIERTPLLLLKDYLRDDLSSCSSNGFRSYPRRQCCTTVRYVLDIDLKATDSKNTTKLLRSKSKAAATTISALKRASEAVINAVKHLPFPSVKSSLSRKLLRRSFWKKPVREHQEIRRWKSFRDLLEEKHKPLDSPSSPLHCTTTTTTTASTGTISNSNSWSGSEFTSDYLQCPSGNSEGSGENDSMEGKKQLPEKVLSTEPTTTARSVENAKKEWPNEEEKEQFSPVSVLDFPFEDEENCSPFQCSHALMEGTKPKLMQKVRRFESLAQLEPVDLDKRIAMSEFDDESWLAFTLPSCSWSIQENFVFNIKKEVNGAQQKAQELLKLFKATIPLDSYKFKADNLLLDFFREKIVGRYVNTSVITRRDKFNYELLKVAEDWINGHRGDKLSMEWEVQDKRKAYIRDMEEGGRWRKLEEEKEEVALEVEVEVLTSLVNEVLFDLFSS